ncbi:hypothetical protein TRFO_33938 [Tritrichomonas foetus]|uniref:Uncharacterized protein n=1 Tax=Tritrichomonas foetus TaxID=1144522 RepID=A0A1J4JQQ3_9EUKA|nr:hypothetical protein TRFO_33938 [Tritrichomonas foetus]|eukprot:OHS99572.1 hypothetical protein TRFO_33938 [Tritrichomonas foetus]
MKKVLVRYPIARNQTKKRKFTVACTTKGTVLRTYIGQHLPKFRDELYFLVLQALDGHFSFLDESKPLTEISPAKKIRLHLILQSCEVSVFSYPFSKSPTTYTIDLKEPVSQNISEIRKNDPQNNSSNYFFAFTPKNDLPRACANSLPLIFQGWTPDDPLYLLRRCEAVDLLDETINNIEMIFEYCKMAVSLKLCCFKIVQWASLACLQCISEGNDLKHFTIQQLLHSYIPNYIHNDPTIISFLENTKPQYRKKISSHEAMKEYSEICIKHGITFCFIDRAKFQPLDVNNKKLKLAMYRFIYISPYAIAITKDFGATFICSETISNIRNVLFDGIFILILFESGDKWRIRSFKTARQLLANLEEMRKLAPRKNISFEISRLPLIDEDDLENDIENEFENDIENKLATDFERSGITYVSDDESDDSSLMEDQMFGVNSYTSNMSIITGDLQPGISKIVIPMSKIGDEPYSPSDEMYRDMKIIEELKLPENDDDYRNYETVPDINWLLDSDSIFSLSQQPVRIIVGLIIALMASVVAFKRF